MATRDSKGRFVKTAEAHVMAHVSPGPKLATKKVKRGKRHNNVDAGVSRKTRRAGTKVRHNSAGRVSA